MTARIEAVRVTQDAEYAASLSDTDWAVLAQDPEWQQLVAEQSELVAPVLAVHGHKLPGANGAPVESAPGANGGPFKIIGSAVARMQGLGIVTNLGFYTQNMRMPGMLYMRTLRSRYPHAKVKSVDTAEAEKLPGVRKVLHRGNLPEEYKNVFLGSQNPTRYLFAEEVFEVGAPIAVVAADSEHIADEAIRKIKVEYEVLPAALDMLEAMKSSTPKQFESRLEGTTIAVATPLVRGDPANARADVVVELVAKKSTEQHVALELTNSLSYWDGDKLNMTYTSQWAHGVRSGLATALQIPQNKVRVVQTGYVGSGYGYRSGIDLSEVHAALLAKLTGRPIKNNYTRYEDFVTRTHRPQFHNEMKLGVNRDGTFVVGQFKVIANVGAQRAGAANGAWYNMQMLYKIPNLRLEGIDVMTNSYKSGPYRCVSHPNGTFALETTIDKAAYAIGMDPVEIRLKNLNETGNPENKRPFSNSGMRDCLVAVRDKIGWRQNWHAPKAKEVRPGVFHGIGIAAHACSHGAGGNPASGQVIINSDGSVQLLSATNDIGPGQRTQMMMIAAEALGVPLNAVTITPYVDTELTTDTSGTFGSQQTNNGGRGMFEAASHARRQVLQFAARKFVTDAAAKTPPETIKVEAADLDFQDGVVVMKSDASKKLTLAQVVQSRPGSNAIVGVADYAQSQTWERTAWAAHAAEVEVDTVTGSVKITRFVAAHDVGRSLNPFALEQQIEGGVVMAVGAVFTEEMLIDKATGLPLNPNLLDYRPLSIKDAPETEVILIEHPKEYGVFGAHGIGEPPMGPPAPAIVNAVYNAVGVWVTDMPLTREKLLAALKAN
jgi:xanthine dehydrogenase molybdenum-binding subunit